MKELPDIALLATAEAFDAKHLRAALSYPLAMDGKVHTFAEIVHPSESSSTLVHAWRDEGARPTFASHAAWDYMVDGPEIGFRLPFTPDGRPTLSASAHVAPWSRGDAFTDGDRSIQGRIASRGVVYRELWVTAPPVFRVAEGIDFVLADAHGELARCFLMGLPLVVGRPVSSGIGAFLSTLGPRARELVRGVAAGREREVGHLVELCEDAAIEIVGPVRANPRASAQSLGPYRSSREEPPVFVGRVPLSHLRVKVVPTRAS